MIPAAYIVIPRGRSPQDYVVTAAEVTRWTVAEDLDGILLFAGSGAHLDPWISAVSLIAATKRVTPMIAVNPAYAHPLTAARFVNSIGSLYSRHVALNFIVGTSLSELRSMGDELDHDARYRRLDEYGQIVSRLLSSRRPVDWTGEFYRVSKAQVLPPLREDLRPPFFLAGKSADARRVSKNIGASLIGMLPPPWEERDTEFAALHFGVVTRPTAAAAWTRARECFPADRVGAAVQRSSMANTDARWKADLMSEPEREHGHYWTGPFRNGHADCPYVVADYEYLAGLLGELGASDIHTVIIDLPPSKEEFGHLATALSVARSMAGDA